MSQIEKTVFISYRRTNLPWALAIYQNLTANDYDVFFDFKSIDSGSFEQVILNNIASRAHFIVLLTPSALERCNEPGDWLRREIEYAIDLKRNVVPLMFEGFDFGSPAIGQYLTSKLAVLKDYNALRVPADYFDEAMAKVRNRFLNVPLDAVIHPASVQAQQAAADQRKAIAHEPDVDERTLTAGEWFEKGVTLNDNSTEELRCYTEAIRLNPKYSEAYYNRGLVYFKQNDTAHAIDDYDMAIRINPDYADAYVNRGLAHFHQGDVNTAIANYTQGIHCNPNLAVAYYNRAVAYDALGDRDREIADYEAALRITPNYDKARNNLEIARRQQARGE